MNNVENRSNIFLAISHHFHHHHRCEKSFISQATVLLAVLCQGSSRLKFWPRWIFRSVETLLEIQHQTKRFSFLCSFQFYHLKMFLFIQKKKKLFLITMYFWGLVFGFQIFSSFFLCSPFFLLCTVMSAHEILRNKLENPFRYLICYQVKFSKISD